MAVEKIKKLSYQKLPLIEILFLHAKRIDISRRGGVQFNLLVPGLPNKEIFQMLRSSIRRKHHSSRKPQ
ncbi:MAG: hypothetical protein ABIR14_00580 [Candidatus Paceibacterota bacterium]